jgi:hypothetical protein
MNGLTICKTDKPFTCGGTQCVVEIRRSQTEYYDIEVDIVEEEHIRRYILGVTEKPQKALEFWENEGGLVR